jgi:hypothetical protein
MQIGEVYGRSVSQREVVILGRCGVLISTERHWNLAPITARISLSKFGRFY